MCIPGQHWPHLVQAAKAPLRVCGGYEHALIPNGLHQHPLRVLWEVLCELKPACTGQPESEPPSVWVKCLPH